MDLENLQFVSGGRAIDDRGGLSFVNDFDLGQFKRFYVVNNHAQGFIRAWHGHKHEAKGVFLTSGSAIVAAVKIDNWETPSKNLDVHRFVLSSQKPGVLVIPAGYANGFKTLTEDATLMFFSTSSLEESANDDIRFESRTWDPWQVVER